jgi:hypothetical protein
MRWPRPSNWRALRCCLRALALERQGGFFWLFLTTVLVGGCSIHRLNPALIGPTYHPGNVYRLFTQLPTDVRRAGILPVTVEDGDWQASEYRRALQSAIQSELAQTKKVEATMLAPDLVQRWTGKEAWRIDERLPTNLIFQAANSAGCDALFFSHVHTYKAYRPLVIGWSMKLVEARSARVLWAVDEVFDASDARVARSAQIFASKHEEVGGAAADPSGILRSPMRFAKYALDALFATLPER